MTSLLAVILVSLSVIFPATANAQTPEQKAADTIRALSELKDEEDRVRIEQTKRDLILGRSSKHDFDNLGTIISIAFLAFIGWHVFKWLNRDREIAKYVEDKKRGRERELEKRAEEENNRALKDLERSREHFNRYLSEDTGAAVAHRAYVRFMTDQKPKDSFWQFFELYIACFDTSQKINSSYGIYSNSTNSTVNEDDDKFESLISEWDLCGPLDKAPYKTLQIYPALFPKNVAFISIYVENGARGDDCLIEFSIEVKLHGLQSDAQTYRYTLKSEVEQKLINIGYFERGDDDEWKFVQRVDSEVSITSEQFTEGGKKMIMALFQKSFKL